MIAHSNLGCLFVFLKKYEMHLKDKRPEHEGDTKPKELFR